MVEMLILAILSHGASGLLEPSVLQVVEYKGAAEISLGGAQDSSGQSAMQEGPYTSAPRWPQPGSVPAKLPGEKDWGKPLAGDVRMFDKEAPSSTAGGGNYPHIQ